MKYLLVVAHPDDDVLGAGASMWKWSREGDEVEVGKEGVDAKIKALGMYRGVMRPYPHPRSAEYITGLAAVRGGQWGVNYAEAFEVVQRAY